MKTYKYKLVNAEEYEEFIVILNREGQNGWDLVDYKMREISDSDGEKISIQAIMKKEQIS